MSYAPKHQKQLDGSPTAGEDCWVRTASMGVDFATRGSKVPTVDAIRDRANVPTGGGNTADQERAVESYDTPNETGGRADLTYWRHVAAPWSEQPVDTFANPDKVVILSLDYGVVNEQCPGLSGDPNFDGNHSVLFCGWKQEPDGDVFLKAFDPLYDGRRAEIPLGPQWWPQWLAKQAAAAFAGDGKWTGGIIATAPLLDDTDPDEPPPPTDEQIYREALEQERTALLELQTRTADRLEVLEGVLAPDTSQASAVVRSGIRPEE